VASIDPGRSKHRKPRPKRLRRYIFLGVPLLAICILAFPPARHLTGDVGAHVIDSRALRLAVYTVWLVPLGELTL